MSGLGANGLFGPATLVAELGSPQADMGGTIGHLLLVGCEPDSMAEGIAKSA